MVTSNAPLFHHISQHHHATQATATFRVAATANLELINNACKPARADLGPSSEATEHGSCIHISHMPTRGNVLRFVPTADEETNPVITTC